MKEKLPVLLLALFAMISAVAPALAAPIEIPLKQLKGPNNAIHDQAMGVSLIYPAGWKLDRAFRWGRDNSETTLGFLRQKAPIVAVSVYYQPFTPDSPRPGDIRVWFRQAFAGKEASRRTQVRSYQNMPESLLFDVTATGLPRCSYVATFSEKGKTMAEYYVRVAGMDAYVMLIAAVPIEHIETIRAEVDEIANTVRVP